MGVLSPGVPVYGQNPGEGSALVGVLSPGVPVYGQNPGEGSALVGVLSPGVLVSGQNPGEGSALVGVLSPGVGGAALAGRMLRGGPVCPAPGRYNPGMRYAKLTAAGILVLSIAAFTVQNSSRTTQLSFDAYFGAWKLVDPAPVPMLLWGAFLLGALLTWTYSFSKSMALSRRVRQLEQEMALSGRAHPASSRPAGAPAPDPAAAKADDGWA